MELTFDEKAHEYKIGERSLPSVTAILKDAGLIDCRFFNDYAMMRGTFVHQACEMLDNGTLDEDTLDPALSGYVQAYKKFREECPMAWTEIEHMRADSVLGYAGTPDRVGVLNGVKIVLDIKTSMVKSRWWGLQLSAYQMLAKTHGRYSLRLGENGNYRLDKWDCKSDDMAWISTLNVYNWKRLK